MNSPSTNTLKTVQNYLQNMTDMFESNGINSARLDALLLLERAIGRPRSWLLAHMEYPCNLEQQSLLTNYIARRLAHEPVAYITGSCEFYGLKLEVNKHTLIPRPETEDLVTVAIATLLPGKRFHDVGTGSGAIALAVRSKRQDVEVSASDISLQALEVAKRNAEKYSMNDIAFTVSDLMDDIDTTFDVIAANLPYVNIDEVQHSKDLSYEPYNALFSHEHGLSHYRRLINQINHHGHLTSGGSLVLEAEPIQHAALIEHALHNGLTPVQNGTTNQFILQLVRT
jgi:release factor glutamine methyltransferase